MTNPVTEYLRQIGAKGGAAGRGPSKARSSEAARAAVQARWAKAKRRKTKSKPNAGVSGQLARKETMSTPETHDGQAVRSTPLLAMPVQEKACINCAHWNQAYRNAWCDGCRDNKRWAPSKSGRCPMCVTATPRDQAHCALCSGTGFIANNDSTSGGRIIP